jgi:hypothetical protein
MKNILVISFLALIGKFSYADINDINRLSSAICDYVKADDRTSIRKKLKTANLKLRQVYSALVCQPEGQFPGGSLLRTATYFGAVDVSNFIIRQVSPDEVAFKEHDGITTLEWAKQAINSGSLSDIEKGKIIVSEMENRITE